MTLRFLHEGTLCKGCKDRSTIHLQVDLSKTDKRVEVGPQGGWRCSAGTHSGWIWPQDMEPVMVNVPYVSRVIASIKGKDIDVELGPKTLIVGPCGSGKSRITDALAIGTGGGYPSVFGRSLVAQKQKLALLGGTPGQLPDVTLTISGAPKATMSHGWKVRDLLTSDATKLRSWAIGAALDRDFDKELELAGAKVRTARQAVRTAEAAAKLGQQAATPPMAQRERTELEGRADRLRAALRGLEASRFNSVADIEAALSTAKESHTAALGAKKQRVRKERADAVALIAHVHLKKGMERCLLCGGDVDEERLEGVLAKMEAVEEPAEGNVERLERQVEALSGLLERAEGIARKAGSLNAARGKLAGIEAKLNDDDSNKRTWKKIKSASRSDAVEASGVLGEAQAELKLLKGEVAEAGSEAAKVLVERASAFLLPGETLALDLDVGVLGLEEDGVTRYGLSGSEYERAVLALSAAAEATGDQAQVICPADVGWDDQTLLETLESWRALPAQVVVATTALQGDFELPAGWTLIRAEDV